MDKDEGRREGPLSRRQIALLAVFGVLFLALLLDVAGISIVREVRPAPAERHATTAAAGTVEPDDAVDPTLEPTREVEQGPPLELRVEPSVTPSPPATSAAPTPARPSTAPSPPAAPRPVRRPTGQPSPTPVETPQEVAVTAERPAEVATTPPLSGPPDGAHVLSDDGRVTLGWPAGSADRWHVEVTAQERPWFAQDVTSPTVTFSAPAGPIYRWRVIARGGDHVVPWRRLQVSDRRLLEYGGTHGVHGRSGLSAGDAGARGQDGTHGGDLEVWVERADGCIRVRLETALGAKETVYLTPSSSPVTVSAAGGRGGHGGRGANGMSAIVHTQGGPVMAVGNGARGGDGGNGGNGGTIRLHGPEDLDRYVTLEVGGGEGGQGGPGGAGSAAAPGPGDTVIFGPPGAQGPGGQDGQRGQPGKIIRLP